VKGACQHIVIAVGIDPSPSMLQHIVLPMPTGLGCPRLCVVCGAELGPRGAWAVMGNPAAAAGSPAALPSHSVVQHHAKPGTGQEI